MRYVVAVIAGSALGLIGARYLFVGSALSLIPWAIAGLALGIWCTRVQALGVGAVYGFALAFVFMVTGYSGSSPLPGRLPAFALLGLVGALCGLVLALLGAIGAQLWRRRGVPS
jgi:hypothetical protein